MTMFTRIVLLPGSNISQIVSASGIQQISARESNRCDDFLKALAEEAKIPGVVHEGVYKHPVGELLICWPDALEQVLAGADDPTTVASSSILIGVTRIRAVAEAESKALAAAIDSAAYAQWLINYPRAEAALYGLRKVQDAFGYEISRNPSDNGKNYVRYFAKAGVSLPIFVARYIRALMN
jgi:hypothetical protein